MYCYIWLYRYVPVCVYIHSFLRTHLRVYTNTYLFAYALNVYFFIQLCACRCAHLVFCVYRLVQESFQSVFVWYIWIFANDCDISLARNTGIDFSWTQLLIDSFISFKWRKLENMVLCFCTCSRGNITVKFITSNEFDEVWQTGFGSSRTLEMSVRASYPTLSWEG